MGRFRQSGKGWIALHGEFELPKVAWLRDGQGASLAGSAATAAEIAGVTAWSVDRNAGCSWARDECGRKCDL